jgi:DNA polymerase
MNVERIIAEIAAEVKVCTKCRLSETRTNAVPGEGSITARIMFVGEGPGQREDATGRPFVGQAGKLLNQLLEQAGIPREDVFITNIVKCRPPQNRVPLADEVLACNDYLMGQIASIEPKFICPLGGAALATLLGPDLKISQVRCQVFRKSGILYVPLYHPAAALHRGALRETLFNDILKLKDLIKRKIREDEIIEMGKPLGKSTFTVGSGGSEKKKNEEPKLF